MQSSNPFCFIVQILLCLSSARVLASPFSQVIVTTTLATEGFPVFQDKSDVRFGVLAYWPQYAFTRHKEATPSTSSLINEASKPWNVASSVSGHGDSLKMQSSNPSCFIVQVGSSPSLHTRRTNNVVLLLFPCPSVICVTVIECYDVVKSLLALSGDIELNPGPMSDVQAKQFADLVQLVSEMNERSFKSEVGQNS
uniref:Secreted protein n=1 Tax=Ixodes ricinus TaxID=34613 RepID=A0A6B0V0U6_IXORI